MENENKIDIDMLLEKANSYLVDFQLEEENESGEIVPIKIKFKVASASVKSDLDLLNEQEMERYESIDAKYKDVTETYNNYELQAGGNEATLKKLCDKDVDMAKKVRKKFVEANKVKSLFLIKKFITIIKTKGLSTDEQKRLMQEPLSEFWQNQKTAKLQEALDFFMCLYLPITQK